RAGDRRAADAAAPGVCPGRAVHRPTGAERSDGGGVALTWAALLCRVERAARGKIGRVLRWTTAGESHGRALVSLVEGMVAGVRITSDDIRAQLARRRLGYGRGARMKFEADDVTVLAGIRHGVTLGGPIAVQIGNTEWPKWETVMATDPVEPADLQD